MGAAPPSLGSSTHRFLPFHHPPQPGPGWAEAGGVGLTWLDCGAQHGLRLWQNLVLVGVQAKKLDAEAVHGV